MRAAVRQTLLRVLRSIEEAVAACVRRRRWDDLEAAVATYARLLRVNPAWLLHTTLVARILDDALALTDPAQIAEYLAQARAGQQLAESGMPLAQSIAMLREAVKQRPAFEAFAAIEAAGDGGVH